MKDHFDLMPLDPIRAYPRSCARLSPPPTTKARWAIFWPIFWPGAAGRWRRLPCAQPPESATGGARWNVYAGVAGQTPDLVFSTHMDTVPPYIPFSEDAEFMYGRGVSDAKGIIAAQVAAAEVLRAAGFRVGLLFVSGEERDSAGAKAANLTPKGSRFLINGEPTDNRLALASKGALRVSSSRPGRWRTRPIRSWARAPCTRWWRCWASCWRWSCRWMEYVGRSTLNIGQIQGGHAPNVIADKAEAQVLVRLVGDSAPVRAALAGGCRGAGGGELHARHRRLSGCAASKGCRP